MVEYQEPVEQKLIADKVLERKPGDWDSKVLLRPNDGILIQKP